jgi:hypothetical protein
VIDESRTNRPGAFVVSPSVLRTVVSIRWWLMAVLAMMVTIARGQSAEPASSWLNARTPLWAYGQTVPDEAEMGSELWLTRFHVTETPDYSKLTSLLETRATLFNDHKFQIPPRRTVPLWFYTVRPGIGEMCPNDTIGRSRTNGAGLQDPTCLYLKMVFRF